jgi:hypothetical protein
MDVFDAAEPAIKEVRVPADLTLFDMDLVGNRALAIALIYHDKLALPPIALRLPVAPGLLSPGRSPIVGLVAALVPEEPLPQLIIISGVGAFFFQTLSKSEMNDRLQAIIHAALDAKKKLPDPSVIYIC